MVRLPLKTYFPQNFMDSCISLHYRSNK